MTSHSQQLPARDVKVLKSLSKPGTYIYLPIETEFDELPETLCAMFGEPKFVLELRLSIERKLAQAEPRSVLQALHTQGFYLQLPPTLEDQKLDR